MVAMATVLPLGEKAGRPGKKVKGASGVILPVATSERSVAPVWSWKAMSFPSKCHAGMICAFSLGETRLSEAVPVLDMSWT